MSALAERYAEALWRRAQTVEVGDQLVSELVAVLDQMSASPLLARTLSDPALKGEGPALLATLAKKMSLSVLCLQFLQMMLERGRLSLIDDVGRALARRADKAASRLRAHVKVPVLPSEAQIHRIEQVLAKRFGKPVIADVQLQPALLGGMLCRIGRLTFDGTLKKQFAQFAERVGAERA